jgi:hypothetical protein
MLLAYLGPMSKARIGVYFDSENENIISLRNFGKLLKFVP